LYIPTIRSLVKYLFRRSASASYISASCARSTCSISKQAKKNNKQVAIRDSRELQVVAAEEAEGHFFVILVFFSKISKTSLFQGRMFMQVSCPNNEGTALIGEKDIRSAAFEEPENGPRAGTCGGMRVCAFCYLRNTANQGWFVLRPAGKTKKRTAFFESLLDPSQCPANIVERMTRTFRVDNMVSGWWRVVALAMLGLLGSATVILHSLMGRRRRRQGALIDSPSSSNASVSNAT
ncbi:hypothetical protein COOONC_18679, partial [Cooperia oncophora]